MEKTLIIEKNEAIRTRTGKTYYQITAGGIKYSCWDLETSEQLRPGTTWVVDTEQNGQFWNISSIVTKIANAREVLPSSPDRPRDPEWGYNRRAALEKATLLAVAIVGKGESMTSTQVMKVADEYFRWLSSDEAEEEPF